MIVQFSMFDAVFWNSFYILSRSFSFVKKFFWPCFLSLFATAFTFYQNFFHLSRSFSPKWNSIKIFFVKINQELFQLSSCYSTNFFSLFCFISSATDIILSPYFLFVNNFFLFLILSIVFLFYYLYNIIVRVFSNMITYLYEFMEVFALWKKSQVLQ